MARLKVKSEYKTVAGMFESLTGSRGMWQVFSDCIELFATAIQNQFVIGQKHEANEQRYLQIISQYNKSEVDTIVRIFAQIVNDLEENPWRDYLGDLYMQLEMGSDALGQFFTPFSVAQMMAKVCGNVDDIREKIKQRGYVEIAEPAIGGGANIIALLEHLTDNGINWQQDAIVVGQDLSRIAALMCYVVLSLIGCSAVIKIGDTLCDPYTSYYDEMKKGSDIWTTPMFHINGCYGKV